MIPSNILEEKAAFDRFSDLMAKVTEWERDNRHAPEYVLRLLEYYIRMEGLIKDKTTEVRGGPSESEDA